LTFLLPKLRGIVMALIDQYSLATSPVEMLFDKTCLSLGTAFCWRRDPQYFIVTNWHNLSGRDPVTGKHLSATAAEPNKIRIWWHTKNRPGEKFSVLYDIKDGQGAPLWWVHPVLGNQVDAVALPIAIESRADMYPINEMPSQNLTNRVGMDVYILGYPFGITAGSHGLPVWKRGSVASEPALLTDAQRFFLIDTASRPGMSGSPVIRRSWGNHLLDNGNAVMGTDHATRVVGIYSGRLAVKDELDAQLGIAWPIEWVKEIALGGRRDDS
jgi:hypothetical protein